MKALLIYSDTFQLFVPLWGHRPGLAFPLELKSLGVRRALEGHMAFSQDPCPGDRESCSLHLREFLLVDRTQRSCVLEMCFV